MTPLASWLLVGVALPLFVRTGYVAVRELLAKAAQWRADSQILFGSNVSWQNRDRRRCLKCGGTMVLGRVACECAEVPA